MNAGTLAELKDMQVQVAAAVQTTTKSELVQCARLLATYVALYKEQYGEITSADYDALSHRLVQNTRFGEAIYVNGMKELLDTLALVELQLHADEACDGTGRTVN